MSPRTLADRTVREVPLLREDQDVGSAVDELLESRLPALPVVDGAGRLKGIFGEREFIGALFPGYLGELRSAAFVTKSLDRQIDRRASCRSEPISGYMNTDHVSADEESYSDTQLAETFLHHRVLIVPLVKDGGVRGVVTRSDFFHELVERFRAAGD